MPKAQGPCKCTSVILGHYINNHPLCVRLMNVICSVTWYIFLANILCNFISSPLCLLLKGSTVTQYRNTVEAFTKLHIRLAITCASLPLNPPMGKSPLPLVTDYNVFLFIGFPVSISVYSYPPVLSHWSTKSFLVYNLKTTLCLIQYIPTGPSSAMTWSQCSPGWSPARSDASSSSLTFLSLQP